MPFMDGEETFRHLRDINPDVVVLLSTGFMAQERVERMLAAGMAGFIRKPHRPDELLAQVQVDPGRRQNVARRLRRQRHDGLRLGAVRDLRIAICNLRSKNVSGESLANRKFDYPVV